LRVILSMATYTKRLLKGSTFLILMSLLGAFIGYFTRIILARNLTPAEYGLFYSVFAFISFFLFFRDLGLNQALVKYIPEFLVKKKYNDIKTAITSVFVWQLISSALFSILLFMFSDSLAQHYFKDSAASFIIKIFILYIIFSMIFLLLQSIFQGFQRMVLFSFIEPLRVIVMFILILILFKLGSRLFAPVYAFTLSWILMSLLLFPFFLKLFNIFKYRIIHFAEVTRTMFAFGLPVLLTSVGARVIARIDTIMLTYFTTLEEVGIYNVVLPSALLFLFFADSISAVALPIISELWTKNDIQKLRDWLTVIYKYSFVFIIPFLFSLFVFPELFINVFFGKDYVGGAMTLQILLIGTLFLSITRLTTTTLVGIGKPALVTKLFVIAAIMNIILNLLFIPSFGIEGAAFATMLSYFVMFLLATRQASKLIRVKVPFVLWIKTVVAASIFVSIVYAVKNLLFLNEWAELVISLGIAGAVYTLLIYFLNIIDIQELKWYLKLIR